MINHSLVGTDDVGIFADSSSPDLVGCRSATL